MARVNTIRNRNGNDKKKPNNDGGLAGPVDENWDEDYDDGWLAAVSREKESSRIQRQMRARRELERLREEKTLRQQMADWPFDD